MEEKEIEEHKKKIDEMSQTDMARLWRFAPSGHLYFKSDLPLSKQFHNRFKELGGITPKISKAIGW
ncbi:hypothetical protein LCGC14_1609960 [marine sediment metagenome]|uniref:Uncharacterized protein n=1 Tax=marine sediment metagenome TaxID=412755 RepID=A0A0F9IVB4_9ZZZZ